MKQSQQYIPLLDLDIDDRQWEVATDAELIQQCCNGALLNTVRDNTRFFSFSNH
jgi:hypothetical protein